MKTITGLVTGLAFLLAASAASAQSNPRYVQFSPSASKGELYTPDAGPIPTIAFLTIHRTANFMSLIATRELAKRGFMVLGMNPRSDNNEASVNFENVALDIHRGLSFRMPLGAHVADSCICACSGCRAVRRSTDSCNTLFLAQLAGGS